MAELLSEKPYSAVFACEMAQRDYFQDFCIKPNLCKQLSAALDNTTIYELDQLAFDYLPTIIEFIVLCKGQGKSTPVYQVGMKLLEMCK